MTKEKAWLLCPYCEKRIYEMTTEKDIKNLQTIELNADCYAYGCPHCKKIIGINRY